MLAGGASNASSTGKSGSLGAFAAWPVPAAGLAHARAELEAKKLLSDSGTAASENTGLSNGQGQMSAKVQYQDSRRRTLSEATKGSALR
jgi:hypothetical protein